MVLNMLGTLKHIQQTR